MNAYLISDLTTSRTYGVIFAKSEKSANAYWTRKGCIMKHTFFEVLGGVVFGIVFALIFFFSI